MANTSSSLKIGSSGIAGTKTLYTPPKSTPTYSFISPSVTKTPITTKSSNSYQTTTPALSSSAAKSTAIQTKSATPSYSATVKSNTPTYSGGGSSYSGGGSTGSSSNNSQLSSLQAQLKTIQDQINAGNYSNPEPVQTQPYSQNPTQNQESNNEGLYSQLIKQLQEKSAAESVGYSKQMATANQYNQALQDSMFNQAQTEAGIEKKPIPLEFQQGMKQITQSQYAKQQAALGSGYTGASNLVNAANTQQGLQQTGLIAAVGAASPASSQTVLSPTQTAYSALGAGAGTPMATAGLGSPTGQANAQAQIQQLANQINSGAISYNQAYSQLSNSFGEPTALQLLPQVQAQNPNFNVNTNAGMSTGQQQSAATTGTMGANVQAQQYGQVQSWTSALQQGKNLQSQLTSLIQNFGINPNDVNALNTGLQKIAQNTSSPQYQALANLVNDIAATYAQILTPAGGTTTDMTRNIATSMLNSSAKGSTILQTMQGLDAQAQAKIAGVYTQPNNQLNNNATSNKQFEF